MRGPLEGQKQQGFTPEPRCDGLLVRSAFRSLATADEHEVDAGETQKPRLPVCGLGELISWGWSALQTTNIVLHELLHAVIAIGHPTNYGANYLCMPTVQSRLCSGVKSVGPPHLFTADVNLHRKGTHPAHRKGTHPLAPSGPDLRCTWVFRAQCDPVYSDVVVGRPSRQRPRGNFRPVAPGTPTSLPTVRLATRPARSRLALPGVRDLSATTGR